MREILFRGKVADEPNEWVIGYLSGPNRITQLKEHSGIKCCEIGDFAVRGETIGQYTGLKDKNGKKIFEGDIIEFKDSTGLHKEIVKFEKGCFSAGIHCGSSTRIAPKLINTRICVVIGNIYDNPELLEG